MNKEEKQKEIEQKMKEIEQHQQAIQQLRAEVLKAQGYLEALEENND